MNSLKLDVILITSLVLCLAFVRCTSNPVGDDGIFRTRNVLSGKVQLDSKNQPEKVFVWLEAFNLSVYTDTNGDFTLTLPSGLYSNINGVFNLYFYVANYQLTAVTVAVKNGEFVPGEQAIASDGKLRQAVQMPQILQVYTEVTPPTMLFNYNGDITIESAFRAVQDTVTVVFPNAIENILGPVFIKNTETGEIFIFKSISLETNKIDLVGTTPLTKSVRYLFASLNLPRGRYKVIPYFFINHEPVPEELLNAIGSNLNKLGLNYLKMPLSLEGGLFTVK